MPRVKFDYVVSFSSEDPDNPASNLLSWEVSKKKWLCGAGESSGSVVVQFDKAVKIGTVQLGAHHAALVELLVGRSESPDQPYQVLVPSCVFLSPAESRRPAGGDKVRSFGEGAGGAAVWAQRWDRLRVVVSQPYNKHCKYGISFVHVFTAERGPAPPPPPPALPSPPALLPALPSSDDDEFSPGELFRQHTARPSSTDATDTGAQIRRATFEAFKNALDSSSKLVKTPLSKDKQGKRDENSNKKHKPDNNLDKQTTKTDRSINNDSIKTRNERHVDRRLSDNSSTDAQTPGTKRKRDDQSDPRTERPTNVGTAGNKRERGGRSDTSTGSHARERGGGERERGGGGGNRGGGERERGGAGGARARAAHDQATCQDPSRLLSDVVCVLSGYVHPERGDIRRAAAALGARVRGDWGPDCTHLICAFPKTPKLRSVRSSPGGGNIPVVLGEWVTECSRHQRRLPEDWFATEPQRRVQRPPQDVIAEEPAMSDDELDFVPDRRPSGDEAGDIGRHGPHSPDGGAAARGTSGERSANSDVEGLVDEDMQGAAVAHDSASDDYDCSTDDERGAGGEGGGAGGAGGDGGGAGGDAGLGATLPNMLEGVRVADTAPAALQRYVRAYGGVTTTVEEMEMADEAEGHDTVYVVCGGAAGGRGEGEGAGGARGEGEGGEGAGRRRVGPQWVWDCHATQTRVHIEPYLIHD